MTLFDLEPDPTPDEDLVELRDDDSAFAQCTTCQTATTAAGLVRFEHGPGSAYCARMLAWEDR